MVFEEKALSEKKVFEGKCIDVSTFDVLLTDGNKSYREVVKHPGGVVVAALKDEDTILMVKQFRFPLQKELLELPAGRLEVGENPDDAIKRELLEETGYEAKEWKSLGFIYTTPGICTEKLYLYMAKDLTFKEQNLDEDEFLSVYEYKLSEVLQMIKDGRINDSKTVCALTRAFL
ncbi:MAG: NUDIX hydrolase [bacterium]|nr:NUDIX hydrolase [bacterium]